MKIIFKALGSSQKWSLKSGRFKAFKLYHELFISYFFEVIKKWKSFARAEIGFDFGWIKQDWYVFDPVFFAQNMTQY